MDFNASIEMFFDEYGFMPRVTSNETIRFHGENLRVFGRYLQSHAQDCFADVSLITAEHLEAYRRFLIREDFKNNTIKGRIKSVRMYFQVLAKAKVLNNVALGLRHDSKDEKQVIPFYDEEVTRMFKTLKPDKKVELRLLTFIQVLLDTGLRLKEIIAMNINDLNLQDKTLFVRDPKGKILRTVVFGQETKKMLLRYFKAFQLTPDDIEKPLFQTLDGRRWNRRTIQASLRQLGEDSGLTVPCNAHRFRHTFGVNSIRAGMNPIVLMRLMGHQDLKTTMHYVYLTNDMAKNGYISVIDLRQTPHWDKAVDMPRPTKSYRVA